MFLSIFAELQFCDSCRFSFLIRLMELLQMLTKCSWLVYECRDTLNIYSIFVVLLGFTIFPGKICTFLTIRQVFPTNLFCLKFRNFMSIHCQYCVKIEMGSDINFSCNILQKFSPNIYSFH